MGREEGSGWGPHVYLWRIHFDIWQNKYNFVKFKNKIKLKKKKVGTFLVVQWLTVCLPVQGIRVQSLIRELSSHKSQGN